MTEWLPLLHGFWADYAPVLLLLSFIVIYPIGYPVAFQLCALALVFGWIGIETGMIAGGRLIDLPRNLFGDLLFDPSLLCLPLLLLLAELMVETGQMERASRAIKGYFDPGLLAIDAARRAKRKHEIRVKALKQEDDGRRSLFMTMFTPASLLLIVVARLFELSPEAMTFALLVPAVLLGCLYLINWLLDLWTDAHRFRLQELAGLTDSIASKGATVPEQGRLLRLLRLIIHIAPPLILVVLAAFLLLRWKLPLHSTFSVLALMIILLSLLQGKFRPSHFAKAAYRALAATGSLAAMMLAAYCFHIVFLLLGGASLLSIPVDLMASLEPITRAWWLLFIVLGLLVVLGFFLDWILLTFILLPMLRPFFASLEFSNLLTPLWKQVSSSNLPSSTSAPESLTLSSSHPFQMLSILEQFPPSRIWIATLVWLALLTSVVTYTRQNGELTARRPGGMVPGGNQPVIGLKLFLILQLIGLTLVLIMPQAVLWLPAHLIG